jgi:hypothetical protein
MAWLSELNMLIAPMSCRMSSAAIVSLADAAFGKGQVFGNAGVQVVADHQHVHMLVQRVDGVGARGVGGAGQHIGLAHHLQDVGRMAAARAFGVEGGWCGP